MSTSPTAGEIPWSEVESFAPFRPATNLDFIDGIQPSRLAIPENTDQLSLVLRWANEHGVTVIVRGGGTKIGWGNRPQSAQLIVSLEKFARIADHAWQDMTVTVEAGVILSNLQSELAKHGQRVPLDALWPEKSTIGGIIATNDSGPLRLRFGSVRDLLLGITVVLADGTIARSGGRVVKNVAGYDLPKLFTGSFGTLGIITEVTLRAYPLPHSMRDVSFKFPSLLEASQFMLSVVDSTLVPVSVQMRVTQNKTIVDLRLEGSEAGIAAQAQRLAEMSENSEINQTDAAAWRRESLFANRDGIVARFSVLPSRIADAVNAIHSLCPSAAVTVQSVGVGILGTEPCDLPSLLSAIQKLGGTLVVLQAPLEIKRHIDVFGAPPSAYPLMVRIKQQFDRNGILSPGRFVGGI